MPARLAVLAAFLFVAVAGPVSGQTLPSTDRARGPWSVTDVLKQRSLSSVNVSPDGRRVLWVKTTPDFDEDKGQHDLYLTYRDDPHAASNDASENRASDDSDADAATVRLTRTGDNRSPRWSPDGRHVAFLSSRKKDDNEKTQIWVLDPRGGSPYRLTSLENGVRSFRWLNDGTLLFSAEEAPSRYEKALKEKKDDVNVIEDTTLYEPVRLFSVEVSSKDVTRQSGNEKPITEFVPSPDGRHVVYSIDPHIVDADARNQPRQFLLDLESGERTEIFAEQYFDPSDFQWTLDGSGFYASDTYASDPEHEGAGIQKLYYFQMDGRSYREVPLDWDNGIGYGGYSVTPDGIHVQLADGPRMKPRFYRKTSSGWRAADVSDERLRHSTSVTIGPDGETIVFAHSRPDVPPKYRVGTYRRGAITDDEQLTTLNSYLDDRPMPKAEVVEWTGAEGETVNGILYYPLNYEEGRQYPLVTTIHGGPSGVDLDAWRLGWTVFAPLWAQRGAFVFRPNYHGSSHHGLDFVESIKGRFYELEIPDIVSGIDYLAEERGLVDTDSLGVIGWSNGAILAIQLTVEHPNMFKVAAPGAGVVNWISDYGNCTFGVRFDDSYFKGPPWEHLDHYVEKAPLFAMEKVRTPTLIHFGTEDRTVPSEQGWQHYRALQQIGNAPVRYLRYPGQTHGLQRLSHQRRKVEEDLKWFDTYLFGTTSMEARVADRLMAADAPLRLLETQPDAASADGRYGVQTGDILVPETVTVGDSLTVGRFEVTRAQYQAFDANYAVADGTANYPATGLTKAQAEAYVAWLSEETGRRYRLPTTKELEMLAEKRSGSSENTPAYWAGTTPTPDEMARLRPRLLRQDPDVLLMPVGSRPPGHDNPESEHGAGPLLYDIAGNAAEWASDADAPIGASAAAMNDAKAEDAPESPVPFRGMRVVVD